MRILLLSVMIIFASSAYAGLYKWVDDEGNVHYSQKRPLGKQFKRIKKPSPAPESSKPLYPENIIKNKFNGVTATETAKNEKIREKKCKLAKEKLERYTIYRRLSDKDGNITIVDDKEREKQIESSKQAINDFCN